MTTTRYAPRTGVLINQLRGALLNLSSAGCPDRSTDGHRSRHDQRRRQGLCHEPVDTQVLGCRLLRSPAGPHRQVYGEGPQAHARGRRRRRHASHRPRRSSPVVGIATRPSPPTARDGRTRRDATNRTDSETVRLETNRRGRDDAVWGKRASPSAVSRRPKSDATTGRDGTGRAHTIYTNAPDA